MLRWLAISILLLPVFTWAQIARTGTPCTAAGSSCTPTAASGVLQIAYAGRDGSATAPSLASGWTSVGTATINGTSSADSAARMACRITGSANQASGTFTNATTLIVVSYTGFKPIGAGTCASTTLGTPSFFTSTVNTTTTTETFNSITTSDSSSWVFGAGYAPAATAGMNTAPSGMSNITSQGTIEGAHDTNGGVSSFSSANVTTTTASRIITGTVEIKSNLQRLTGAGSATPAIHCDVCYGKGTPLGNNPAFNMTASASVTSASGSYTADASANPAINTAITATASKTVGVDTNPAIHTDTVVTAAKTSEVSANLGLHTDVGTQGVHSSNLSTNPAIHTAVSATIASGTSVTANPAIHTDTTVTASKTAPGTVSPSFHIEAAASLPSHADAHANPVVHNSVTSATTTPIPGVGINLNTSVSTSIGAVAMLTAPASVHPTFHNSIGLLTEKSLGIAVTPKLHTDTTVTAGKSISEPSAGIAITASVETSVNSGENAPVNPAINAAVSIFVQPVHTGPATMNAGMHFTAVASVTSAGGGRRRVVIIGG